MQEEDLERELKILVVGDGGVGKSSMIRKFCRNQFSNDYKKTIGVDFLEKNVHVPELGEDVRLFLWDTAGQENFDSLTRSYYRGANAAVLVYSVTDRSSFEAIKQWHTRIKYECGDIPMALVQNKVDLLDRGVVSTKEAEDLAQFLQLRFYRTCVKEGLNVLEVFQYLTTQATTSDNIVNNSSQPLDEQKKKESGVSQGSKETQISNGVINLTAPSKRRTNGKKQNFNCNG
eukprot:TRINITY_DN50135_c1_g3_i1.p2 TRINITY_DN50135_c1_g3~~TRINITY_DN50135_c1_g3_i1.p2  ORF type:complete len:231 (-),score=28.97 TRINITY_DN50135_c1_g3_i1:255-947(-)